VYLSSLNSDAFTARREFEEWRSRLIIDLDFGDLPIFTREDLPRFISLIYHCEKLPTPPRYLVCQR